MPTIQRAFFGTIYHLQQAHPHVLQQPCPPPPPPPPPRIAHIPTNHGDHTTPRCTTRGTAQGTANALTLGTREKAQAHQMPEYEPST